MDTEVSKNEKLIKLNKTKIIVIVSIVIILIVSISVGIYFAVRPSKQLLPDNIKWTSASSIQKKVTDDDLIDSGKITGVYIGSKSSDESNLSIYGSTTEKDELLGPFSTYLETFISDETEYINWYGVNLDNSEEVMDEFKKIVLDDDEFEKGDNPLNSEYILFDDFFYIGKADNDWYGSNSFYYNKYAIELVEGDDPDSSNLYDKVNLTFSNLSVNSGEDGKTPTISDSLSDPIWMWFYEGDLIYVASGFDTETNDDNNEVNVGDIDAKYWNEVAQKIIEDDGNPHTDA